eukprot:5154792-Pyramimonas_sp.AAC.1
MGEEVGCAIRFEDCTGPTETAIRRVPHDNKPNLIGSLPAGGGGRRWAAPPASRTAPDPRPPSGECSR